MGVVWKARQLSLNRLVAIKMIRPSVVSETGLARFKDEAQLAAQLKHPGIVPVHDFGEQDGRFYLCMDFIHGETLAARLVGGALSPKEAAGIVRDVADAIQYAHEHEIIHRDLKPANILLDADQSGRPRVADFGLARRIDVARDVTLAGNVLGTPGYMSPEQASGQTSLVKKPTDIFSLGAILYEALTGRPPFSTSDWLEVCRMRPDPPRSIDPDVPAELEAICIACLAKKPEDRLTANGLVSRLNAFLGNVATHDAGLPATVLAQTNHVVICGLGDLGLRLALEGRSRGKPIIAIEQRGNTDAIEQARANGVEVIEGDAGDEAVLREAQVERADFIVAACREDQINIAIAARVGQLLPPRLERREPLVCRLLITDYELRSLLADESLFPSLNGGGREMRSKYRINFGDLNLHDTAARQCLRMHNLDFEPIRREDETTVHLIVSGFGPMGQSLALHAARIGHFSNAAARERRLRITVVDDAETAFSRFQQQFSKIGDICDLRFRQADRTPSLVNGLDQLSADAAESKELVTYAVCLEKEQTADDRQNLEIGLKLSGLTAKRPVQTLIYQGTRRGFASLFPAQGTGAGLSPRLHAFGMKEDIYSWDVLLHESEDRLARALHEDFQQQRRSEGALDSKNPAWEDLEEDLRESNRHAADHIPIKLRALGYHNDSIKSGKTRIERFTEDEIQLLGRMEHSRWCAERWLAGWRRGPEKDVVKKLHPLLIPWNELPPQEQKKDHEQINAIPRVLDSIGQGIYR